MTQKENDKQTETPKPKWIVLGNVRIDGQMQVDFYDEKPNLMPGQTLYKVLPQ